MLIKLNTYFYYEFELVQQIIGRTDDATIRIYFVYTI